MSLTKKILLILLAILVGIQFFHPEKNQSLKTEPRDIFAHYPASDNVKQLVNMTCYDCHSNSTVYPWYSNIQPVAWWLNHHIEEGKKELNFSEFAAYTPKKADHKLEEAIENIEKKEMPLESYTLVHHDADLTGAQRDTIIEWMKATRKLIVAK